MDVTTNDGWENRLEELIAAHIRNLQNDFRRMLDEVVVPDPPDPEPPADLQSTLSRLKDSVDAILAAGTQREMAHHLLEAVAGQSCRAAILLARGEELRGYQTRGFAAPLDDISGFATEPGADDPLAAALAATQHLPGSALAGTALGGWVGDVPPAQVCLAPVMVGGRTVAMVYADSGDGEEAGRIHPEAIEILSSMAGLFLDRLRHAVRPPTVLPEETIVETREDRADAHPADDEAQGDTRPGVESMYGAAPAIADAPDRDAEPVDAEPVDADATEAATSPAFSSGSLPLSAFEDGDGPEPAVDDEPEPGDSTRPDAAATRFDPGATVQIPAPSLADEPVAAPHPEPVETSSAAGDAPETMEFDPMASPDRDVHDNGMPGIRTPELRDGPETASDPTRQELLGGPPSARDVSMSMNVEVETGAGDELAMDEPAPLDLDWTPPSEEDAAPFGEPEAFEPPEETLADMASTAAPASPAAAPPEEVTASDVPVNEDAERFARLLVSEIVLYNEAAVKAGRKSGDLYRRLKDSVDRSRDAFADRFGSDLLGLFDQEVIRTLAGGEPARMGSGFDQART